MAIYDTLFSQLDVTSAQLLVTDNDFRDSDFRKQLTETGKSLLSLKVAPIFNENDAVSTRKAPYEDYTGEDVTVNNVFAAILGNKSATTGGSGKVVESGPNDHIFIYYSDHGGPGVLECAKKVGGKMAVYDIYP